MKKYLSEHPKVISAILFILMFVGIGLMIAYPPFFFVLLVLSMFGMMSYLVWDLSSDAAVAIARRLRR